jgi:hypothetical protein
MAAWKRSPTRIVCEACFIPWGDHEHDAQRLAFDHAAEARTLVVRHHRLQAFLRDAHHGAGALLDAPEFAAVADGPTHLLGEFRHRLLVRREERVEETQHGGASRLQRSRAPRPLRVPGGRDRGVDRGIARERAADQLAAVDR